MSDLLQGSSNEAQKIIAQARSAEERYDWLEEAKLLESVSASPDTVSEDLLGKIASSYASAAFQAQFPEEFQVRLKLSLAFYEKGASLLDKQVAASPSSSESPSRLDAKKAKSLVFRSKAALVGCWLEKAGDKSSIEIQKALLYNSKDLAEKAFMLYEKSSDDALECCIHLLSCLLEQFVLESNKNLCNDILTSALNYGKEAIEIFSSPSKSMHLTRKEEFDLCRLYYISAWFCGSRADLSSSEEMQRSAAKMEEEYWKRGESIAKKLDDPLLLAERWIYDSLWRSPGQVKNYVREVTPIVLRTKDNLLIAGLNTKIAYGIIWTTYASKESSDAFADALREVEESFNEARRRYELVTLVGVHSHLLASCYYNVLRAYAEAVRLESDPERRQELMRTAGSVGKEAFERLQAYPIVAFVGRGLASILKLRADLETSEERKAMLLDEALAYEKGALAYTQEFEPRNVWNLGFSLASLASLEFSRSALVEEKERQIVLLKESLETISKGVDFMTKGPYGVTYGTKPSLHIANWLDIQSDILLTLYRLTNDKSIYEKRLGLLERAKQTYLEADLPSQAAETLWEIGNVQSTLLDHFSASRSYEEASSYFLNAAEKIPKLKMFFSSYASYMQAWSMIATARHSHSGEHDYEKAKQLYEKASTLLSTMQSWSYLSTYFRACAKLEVAESEADFLDAETLVRKFEEADSIFKQSYHELSRKVGESSNLKERESTRSLSEAALLRSTYCQGRVNLAKAGTSYRRGNRNESIREYSSSAKIFEELLNSQREGWQSREYVLAIIAYCKSWEKMEEAEIDLSPENYTAAAELFAKAQELFRKQNNSEDALVCKGNSDYCLALASGLKFKQSWRIDDYIDAKSHLSAASDCYSNAGFAESDTEWFRATERMLDAYVYIGNALKLTDPESRIRNYAAAERALELSAEIYERAGFTGRKEEILSMIKKIRGEKEFSLSLVELFTPPPIVGLTNFSVNAPPQEMAIGLSELHGANVQILLNIPASAKIDEPFQIKLDLINVGKGPANLLKIQNLISSKLKIEERDDEEQVWKEGNLELHGKKIESFEIVSISISARGVDSGELELAPRLIYSDESGKIKESTTSLTKTVVTFPSEFKFQKDKAGLFFDYLVDSFIEDYMRKSLAAEKSGWRTLADISRGTGTSTHLVYGVGGKLGGSLQELLSKGLVETRIFSGERGRGGEILKLRLAYEKDPLRQYVNERVRSKSTV